MQVCKHASMQAFKYGSMHIYASMQVCMYASMQVCKYTNKSEAICMSAVAAFLLLRLNIIKKGHLNLKD